MKLSLPEGWVELTMERDGELHTYYEHREKQITQWEHPTALTVSHVG
jgi:hypothetical protein